MRLKVTFSSHSFSDTSLFLHFWEYLDFDLNLLKSKPG